MGRTNILKMEDKKIYVSSISVDYRDRFQKEGYEIFIKIGDKYASLEKGKEEKESIQEAL